MTTDPDETPATAAGGLGHRPARPAPRSAFAARVSDRRPKVSAWDVLLPSAVPAPAPAPAPVPAPAPPPATTPVGSGKPGKPRKKEKKHGAKPGHGDVELVVVMPKGLRKRLRERAADHGLSAEQAVLRLVEAWVD